MADLWLDVDTALSEVPVNLLPLIDDTDFKTREESVVYNQAGLDLVWNFITTAGVFTQTAVTPTDTAGAYDWVNQGNGMYTIEIPATGGASINNDTEGFGWFTGFATGILPWRGPVIGFRAAGLNDALVDSAYSATRGLAGTALPAAAADAAGGLPISDAGGLDLDAKIGGLTFTVAGDVDVNVQTWGGAAIATPPAVNATQISGDSAAADTLELFAEALDQATGQIDTGTLHADVVFDPDLETVRLHADYDAAKTAASQASVNTIDGIVDSILAALAGVVPVSGTIGATGNDTTHLHLDGLAWGDDGPNSMLLTILDVSTGLYYSRWIEDFATTGDLATVATLPFTPEASVDQYWVTAIRADVADDAVLAAIAAMDAKVDIIDGNVDDLEILNAAMDVVLGDIDAQTSQLNFNAADRVLVDVREINDVAVIGDGAATPWGP